MTTKYPFSFLPYLLTRMLIVSPAQWEKVGKTWAEFAKNPSGTGPFKITKVVLGQYAEMSRNEEYWDKARIPKLDKMVVYPMPEATTRVAALRSGQVDWIEVPPPDSIPSLKQAGLQISLWPYPHTYPYALNCLDGSPFKDVRVRQALNYAVDREGMCKMLNGTAKPAMGLYPPDNPMFGTPKNRYTYDPEKAKALLKEAGYGPDKPVKAKIMISTSGSGQMVPIPMNEFMQQNFKAVGMDIDFDVVEWGTMLVAIRNAPTAPQSHGDDGINISLSFTDPSSMFRYYAIDSFSPTNYNWGHWGNQPSTDLLRKAQATFDPAEQNKLLAQAHEIVVDEAPWLFIVHDLNPRAMSKKVTGFQSGAELVPGLHPDHDGLAQTVRQLPCQCAGHNRCMNSRSAGAHFAASAPEARCPWSLSISKYVASTPALRRLRITPGARLGGNNSSVRDSTYSTGTRIRARSGVTS